MKNRFQYIPAAMRIRGTMYSSSQKTQISCPSEMNQIKEGGFFMSDLVVIGFKDKATAEDLRIKLIKLQGKYLVDLEDAVVAVKNKDGKIKLNQTHHLTAAGALSGTFWGMLIGLIFYSPFLGAAAGAAAGAISGSLADVGIDDNFMKKLSETLKPESSALFILVRKVTADKVLEQLEPYSGKILQTSLNHEDEKLLKIALEDLTQPNIVDIDAEKID